MKDKKRKKVSYAKYGYLFSMPFAVAFAVCMLYPLVRTLIIAFTDMQGIATTDFHFLDDPFGNFKAIFEVMPGTKEAVFVTALKNTCKIWIVNFIPQMLLALLLAAWFTNNQHKIKGQGFFKVVFYLPNIITQATIAILFGNLFAYPKGPVNDILLSLGLIEKEFYFTNDGLSSWLIVAYIQFWMWFGNTMIVLISGILGISPELFEAAEIDGADARQQFFYVTIPNVKTILLYTLVTSLIGGMQMFDIPKMFLNGGPSNATLTTSVFIHNQAFGQSYKYNTGAAASIVMFIIIGIFSALLFFLMRDKDEAALNKIVKKQEREYKKQLKEGKKLAKEAM